MNDSESGHVGAEQSGTIHTSLLQRACQQDEAAWQRIVRLYTPLLHYWCQAKGLAQADRDDLIQDIFLRVFQALDRFERGPDGSFRGWLRTVTSNRIADHFRAAHGRGAKERAKVVPLDEQAALALEDTYDDGHERRELFNAALSLLERDVPPRTFAAFRALAVDGRSGKEVAEELGMTLGSVYQAKYEVFQRLRVEMEGLVE